MVYEQTILEIVAELGITEPVMDVMIKNYTLRQVFVF